MLSLQVSPARLPNPRGHHSPSCLMLDWTLIWRSTMLLCLSLCLLHLPLSLSLFLCLSLSWSTGSNSTFLVSVPRSWHISDFREQSTLRTKPELRTGAKQATAPPVAIARPGKRGLTAYAGPAEELPLGTGKVSGSVLLTTPFFPLSTLTRDQNLAGMGIQQPRVARLPREVPLSLQNVPPVSEHKPQAQPECQAAWGPLVGGGIGDPFSLQCTSLFKVLSLKYWGSS